MKRTRRVQVDFTQLTRWYRTLDRLNLNKSEIEVALYRRLRDLFDFQPELVLYDLTSTYFEGRGPASAKHGYSRDGKKRNAQVVVGVVMVVGWPIMLPDPIDEDARRQRSGAILDVRHPFRERRSLHRGRCRSLAGRRTCSTTTTCRLKRSRWRWDIRMSSRSQWRSSAGTACPHPPFEPL